MGNPHVDLLAARLLTFGVVVLAFPAAMLAVFGFGTDRNATADALSVAYACGIALALSTSFWPLPSLRSWDRAMRVESLVLVFLGMSYATHLSWELAWLLFHDAIRAHPEAPWAYPWWAYIDGGDLRYRDASATVLALETLSVLNGLVGVFAMRRFLASGRTDRGAVLAMTGTAVVHLYSASFYFLSELLAGMPSVDTTSFVDTYVKFGLANAPWVVVPGFVFAWAKRRLASAR